MPGAMRHRSTPVRIRFRVHLHRLAHEDTRFSVDVDFAKGSTCPKRYVGQEAEEKCISYCMIENVLGTFSIFGIFSMDLR